MHDRHSRGLRGPLSLPNPYTKTRLWREKSNSQIFQEVIGHLVNLLEEEDPGCLAQTTIAVGLAPKVSRWQYGDIPISEAKTGSTGLEITLYRKPIEGLVENEMELLELIKETLKEHLNEAKLFKNQKTGNRNNNITR